MSCYYVTGTRSYTPSIHILQINNFRKNDFMLNKKMIHASIAVALVLCLFPSTALADTWYIDDYGDITITADASGQTVNRGSKTVADNNPVFTPRSFDIATYYSRNITIITTEGATANLTLNNVQILSTRETGAINIGASNANVTLEGYNYANSNSGPAIYVTSGDLSITGDGSLLASGYYHNGIGSGVNEDMSGTIFIGGDVDVTATSVGSSGIGSGNDSEMSGLISIGDNATVIASADEVGIGCGSNGIMSGTIVIGDNANVTANGWQLQPGIGAGHDGVITGTISITDNAIVQASSLKPSTTIGCDEDKFTGTIEILDNAQVIIGTASSGYIRPLYFVEFLSELGHIGADKDINHTQLGGEFYTGVNTTINGVKGDDVEALKNLINMHLDENGNPINHFVVYPPVAPPEVEPAQDPKVEPVYKPLYRVVNNENHDIPYTAETANGVLTITTDFDQAILTGTLANLSVLANYGVQTIVFKTNGAQSIFSLTKMIAAGSTTDVYAVFHDGSVSDLTIANQTVSGILN